MKTFVQECITIIENANNRILESRWVQTVKTKWKPPKGLFDKSAKQIASTLASASRNHKQAMDRLNFFINRGGDKLKNREKYLKARDILSRMGKVDKAIKKNFPSA